MIDHRFDWGVTRVTPSQFEKQILFLIKHGYTTQTLTDYLQSGFPVPAEKRVCITFDDAYESIYHNAFPIMAKYNIPGTVFVITGYVGELNTWDVNLGGLCFPHLNWEQIRSLSNAGWEIASHTHVHRDLTRLSKNELINELVNSKSIIEKKVGKKVCHLAYPFSKVSLRVATEVVQAGYKAAVTMTSRNENIPASFRVTRFGVYLFDNLTTLNQKITGRAKWMHQVAQRCISMCSTGSIIVKEMF